MYFFYSIFLTDLESDSRHSYSERIVVKNKLHDIKINLNIVFVENQAQMWSSV